MLEARLIDAESAHSGAVTALLSNWVEAGYTKEELAELVGASPALDEGRLAEVEGRWFPRSIETERVRGGVSPASGRETPAGRLRSADFRFRSPIFPRRGPFAAGTLLHRFIAGETSPRKAVSSTLSPDAAPPSFRIAIARLRTG